MTNFNNQLINPDLPVVRDYDDRYDESPINEVIDAAENGDVTAIYELASRYRLGVDGVDRDAAKAADLYKVVLEQQNNMGAFYHAGFLIRNDAWGNDREGEAIAYYKAAYELGSADAAVQLGLEYIFGELTPQDFNTALEYFFFAVDHSREDAWEYIGDIYREQGKFTEAKNCYEKVLSAVQNPNESVAGKLGAFYEFGADGIEIDNNKALNYYELAYSLKDPRYPGNTAFDLARFLFYEKSGKSEDKRAFELFLEDQNLGNKRSNLFLGYYYGLGISNYMNPDIASAFDCLNDVLEDQKPTALYYRGVICLRILHDENGAKRYLSEAADLGSQDAEMLLKDLNRPNNPLAPTLQKVSEMLGESTLASQLIHEINNNPDPATIVQYAESILAEGKIVPAALLMSGAEKLFRDNPKVINEYVKLLNIFLYGRYVTNKGFDDESLDLCKMVLERINKLRSYPYGDKLELDTIESNMYFNIGYYYHGINDNNMALDWYSKASIDLTPNTAQEIFAVHTENIDQYFNVIYLDEMNLKRALNSLHWASDHDKSFAYFCLSYIYVNGAPQVPRDLTAAYQCIEQACLLNPENSVFQEEKSRFKIGLFGKISYK